MKHLLISNTERIEFTKIIEFQYFSRLYLLLIFVFPVAFSCTNVNDGIVKDQQIKKRDGICAPGSYSESGGRLVFPTADDFKQTIDFFECASPEDIDDWSRDFDVETPGKDYRSFMAELDENTTDGEYGDLLDEYGKGIVLITIDTATVFRPLFLTLNEICNIDGEFKIDDAVIKVTENKIISITKPSIVSPSTVNDMTTTDTTNGVFVYNLRASIAGGECCPASDDETIYYSVSGLRRRLRTDFDIYNLTTFQTGPNNKFNISPLILVQSEFISQRKVGIWPFKHYVLFDVNQVQHLDVTFSHNIATLTSPITVTFDNGVFLSDFLVTAHVSTFQSTWALFRPSPLTVCVSDLDQTLTDIGPIDDPTAEIECP